MDKFDFQKELIKIFDLESQRVTDIFIDITPFKTMARIDVILSDEQGERIVSLLRKVKWESVDE